MLAAQMLAALAPALAQTPYPDVRVLVAGEDEDLGTVRRSDEIFQGVIDELKGVLSRAGFHVIDEDAVAVGLGWKIRDRRPRMDLIGLAKDMNQSDKAAHHVRALVLFSIHVVYDHSPYSHTRILVRLRANIYDLASSRFIDTHHPKEELYKVSPLCRHRDGCKSEAGRKARDLAPAFGAGLATKLARYRDVAASGGGTRKGDVGVIKPAGSGHGIETPYTVTFNYFDRREAVTIVAVMADEFPGYRSHRLMRTDQAVRKYSYRTTAKPAKLEEWLTVLLADMNFDPDKEIRIAIDGTDITVDKIVPTPDRPRSADERAIFK